MALTRSPVPCAHCGAIINRVMWNPSKKRPILHSFCNNGCKGAWQTTQREALGFTKEWLVQKYIIEMMDCTQIAKVAKRNSKQVWQWISDYGIPTRPRGSHEPNRFKKGVVSGYAGRVHTEETKEKLREARRATGNEPYKNNGHYLRERRGPKHPNWKGGISGERQAFYASTKWKEACKSVWARSRGVCERCGVKQIAETRGTFDVHHIVSFRVKALRAEPTNLVLLCEECHYFVHSKANVDNQFISRSQA